MRYSRPTVAVGFFVGLILLTLMLRVKFYFFPPTEITFQLPNQAFDLPTLLTDDAPTTTVQPTTITPEAVTTSVIQFAQTVTQSPGVEPSVVTLADSSVNGYIFGQQYVIEDSVDNSIKLTDDISLIAGQLPYAQLFGNSEGLFLYYLHPSVEASYVAEVKQFHPTTYALQTSWPVVTTTDPELHLAAAIDTDYLHTAYNESNQDIVLNTYNFTGTLHSEQLLKNSGSIVSIIPDNNASLILVSQTTTQLIFSKVSLLGDIQQQVALDWTTPVLQVVRDGPILYLVQAHTIAVVSDNLATRYPDTRFSSEALFPTLTLVDDQVQLNYAKASGVSDYTLYRDEYTKLAPIE